MLLEFRYPNMVPQTGLEPVTPSVRNIRTRPANEIKDFGRGPGTLLLAALVMCRSLRLERS